MLKDLLTTYIQSKDKTFLREDGSVHDRDKTLGASEAWQCLRKTYFSKTLGEDRTQARGFFERGDVMEDWFIDNLKAALPDDNSIIMAGDSQTTLVYRQLSCTPDGVLIRPDDFPLPIEVKSIDPRTNIMEPKPQHVMQVQIQMGMLHRTTDLKPIEGVIVYINSSNWLEITEHFIEYDPAVIEGVLDRADKLFAASSASDLQAEGYITDECKYCPFTSQCGQEVRASMPSSTGLTKIKPEFQDRIIGILEKRQAVSTQVSSLSEEKSLLDEQIKEFLREQDTDSLSLDNWAVSYKFTKGRKTLDLGAVSQAGIDLSEFYTEGQGSERLTVRAK